MSGKRPVRCVGTHPRPPRPRTGPRLRRQVLRRPRRHRIRPRRPRHPRPHAQGPRPVRTAPTSRSSHSAPEGSSVGPSQSARLSRFSASHASTASRRLRTAQSPEQRNVTDRRLRPQPGKVAGSASSAETSSSWTSSQDRQACVARPLKFRGQERLAGRLSPISICSACLCTQAPPLPPARRVAGSSGGRIFPPSRCQGQR